MGGWFIQKKLSFIEKDVQRWPFRLSTNMLGRYIKRGQQQRIIRFLYSERIYIPRIYSFASLQVTFRQQLYFFVYITRENVV